MTLSKPFYTSVSSSEIIGQTGVGSIYSTKNGVSALVCALPYWVDNIYIGNASSADRRSAQMRMLETQEFHDSHLESLLHVERFMKPLGIKDEFQIGENLSRWLIPAVRFPQYEYCSKSTCGAISKIPSGEAGINTCAACTPPQAKWGSKTKQIPAVLICREGHLDEIDWFRLYHERDKETSSEEQHTLRYHDTDMYRYAKISCSCKEKDSAVDILSYFPLDCTGRRPHLPDYNNEECKEKMILADKVASSIYYSDMRSMIHLPLGDGLSDRFILWLQNDTRSQILIKELRDKTEDETLLGMLFRRVQELYPAMSHKDFRRHAASLFKKPEGDSPRDDDSDVVLVRFKELEAITPVAKIEPEEEDSFASLVGRKILEKETFPSEAYSLAHFGDRIHAVTAVTRLAETRVQASFSRVEPPKYSQTRGEKDNIKMWGKRSICAKDKNDRLYSMDNWLPAYRVYGEGILIEFSRDKINQWSQIRDSESPEKQSPAETQHGYAKSSRVVMAHTFAHILMRTASLYCGYSLSSIRDRIYDVKDSEGRRRLAVLIYTTDGDALGTMGGLVGLAYPGMFEKIFNEVIDNAHWCPHDPVCMNPSLLPSSDYYSGACHQCCLLPETSCEIWNKWLDRGELIGRKTPKAETGYFYQ